MHYLTVTLHFAKYTDIDEETTVPIDESQIIAGERLALPDKMQPSEVHSRLPPVSFMPHSLLHTQKGVQLSVSAYNFSLKMPSS